MAIAYLKSSKCQSQQTLSTELLSYQHINRSRVMPDNEAICREIKRIYAMLDKYSIDGLYFSYIAPVRDDKTTRYNLNLLDNSYYSGIWGVLMFHAAYATWNNNSVLRDTILKKIKELLRPYFDGSDESVYLRLGLAEGVSGVLKSMICIAKILDEPNLVDSAVKIANRVGENYLRRSWGSDLFGGIAGYLFVVCQLYLLTRDEMLYGQIRAACEELKSRNTVESTNQLHVWKSEMEYAPLTGLAHGQAGFAMALSAAYAVTSDDTLLTFGHSSSFTVTAELSRCPRGHPLCVPLPCASPAICGGASYRSAFQHRWWAERRSHGICGSSGGASEGQ